MKNIIYFFSATGNSLKMTKELAQRLETTEIVQMRQELLNESNEHLRVDADHIGFIFPTIFSGIPKLVDNVIRRLQITNPAPYIYAVATCGDKNGSGIVFEQISSILKEKNLCLSASFSIFMPHSMPEKDHALTRFKREQLIKEAVQKIPFIANSIQNHEMILYKNTKLKMFFEGLIHKSITSGTKKRPIDRLFSVEDNCIGCNQCSKVCPANNIEMVAGKPKWKLENCQACFACAQWCPVTAIQYTKRTIGIERYHHPGIKVQELFYKDTNAT